MNTAHQPEPRCRIHRDVRFAPGTRYEFTLRAGSVVAWSPSPLNGPGAIRVHFAGRVATISMDDASPVEWDDAEQQWVEALHLGSTCAVNYLRGRASASPLPGSSVRRPRPTPPPPAPA